MSGLVELDKLVINHVWERMDELIRSVQHVDIRDISISTYHNSNVDVESVCDFADLKNLFNEVREK